MIKCVLGIIRPDSGEILVDGRNVLHGGVLAQLGAHVGLHVLGPPAADAVDEALHAGVAHADGVDADAGEVGVVTALERAGERIRCHGADHTARGGVGSVRSG